MKSLLFILSFIFSACFISCGENDIVEGFNKVELQQPLKGGTGNRIKENINKRLGIVTICKDGTNNMGAFVYLEDKDNYYLANLLPEKYRKDGLIIMFSGNIYYPGPKANTYNPLKGLDFEITDLWVKE